MGLECKSRKSRNTWNNRQIWPWSIGWSRAKAKRVCQKNTLAIGNTLFQQHKRRLHTWTSPDGQHWIQIVYILCSQRWKSSIQSAKTRPGANCGSGNELLIAKFRLELKKVGKTTRTVSQSVQSLSRVWLFVTPWIAAGQASLSITNSQSLLKLMFTDLVMPSNHLILCRPLLLPPIPPSIRVFSNVSTLRIRWPKYWSFIFSISPSYERPGLISFRMD